MTTLNPHQGGPAASPLAGSSLEPSPTPVGEDSAHDSLIPHPTRQAPPSALNSHPNPHLSAHHPPVALASVRVLLVGRTGLDALLRHDPHVELVRAYHPLGAIGELASPIDDLSPAQTLVIVGQNVVATERARAFVTALRRVDPAVRVLAIATENLPVFDGIIPPDVQPDSLRQLVHGVHAPVIHHHPLSTPAHSPHAALTPRSSLLDAPLDAPLEPTDEEAVLEVLLAGRGSPSAAPSASPRSDPSSIADALSPADRNDAELAQAPQNIEHPHDNTTHRLEPEQRGIAAVPAGQPAEAAGGFSNSGGVTSLDVAPIRAMLMGESPTPGALTIVRALSGVHDLDYVRNERLAEPGDGAAWVAPATPHIKIMHQNVVLGYLHSPAGLALTRLTPEQTDFFTAWASLSEQDAQLRDYAFRDELTGAFNRRFFNRFMVQALEEAAQTRRFLTVLYFDIDDFKLYNDRFGHAAGDEILEQTVALLKSVIRPTDKVCRMGGDEFAVIFYDPASSRRSSEQDADSNIDAIRDARGSGLRDSGLRGSGLRGSGVGDPGVPRSIAEIASRFQRQICDHKFPKLAEQAPGTLTISGGMASFPWDGRTTDELLARADQLLLQSKAQGKNLITLGPGSEQVCRLSD